MSENRKLTMEELGRKTPAQFREAQKTPLVFILDNVRSMNNVGSVFRSSDAFLVSAVILCGITPVPPHREIQKTALGATESVLWKYYDRAEDALHELKSEGWTILSAEQAQGSKKLGEFEFLNDHKYAIILGNEVDGVQQHLIDLSDHCLEIPQEGTKHSLNISVAAGILAWEVYRQLKK